METQILKTPWIRKLLTILTITLVVFGIISSVLAIRNLDQDNNQIRGGDFLQFHTAARIAVEHRGQGLYDQDFFLKVQLANDDLKQPTADRFYSLYPPITAFLFLPLGFLSFSSSLKIWWVIQITCILLFAFWTWKLSSGVPERLWGSVAILVFSPLHFSLYLAHLAPILLVILGGGLLLYRIDKKPAAGLVLSLLLVKPQLLAGLWVWIVIRRDWKLLIWALTGLLIQLFVSALFLDPRVWLDYFWTVSIYGELMNKMRFSAAHQHGLASALHGLAVSRTLAMLVHLVYVFTAGFLMYKLVRDSDANSNGNPDAAEISGLVLFLMVIPPHLLSYDLLLLLIPIFVLWYADGSAGMSNGKTISAILFTGVVVAPVMGLFSITLMPFLFISVIWMISNAKQNGNDLPLSSAVTR